jgi:hypothetical protein
MIPKMIATGWQLQTRNPVSCQALVAGEHPQGDAGIDATRCGTLVWLERVQSQHQSIAMPRHGQEKRREEIERTSVPGVEAKVRWHFV